MTPQGRFLPVAILLSDRRRDRRQAAISGHSARRLKRVLVDLAVLHDEAQIAMSKGVGSS